MIKKVISTVFILAIFVIAVWFSYLNTEDISINLSFIQFSSKASIIFSIIFISGWLFGILCSLFYTIKILNQKRIIKSDLDQKIEELNTHRTLPLKDAN
jgi:uncharacterized membrane protein YciS (DUF1049 family)|tara:strand:+ start:1493 stop:1789 length:297 start_codon:yes stop_codon:yes gene_type:complete